MKSGLLTWPASFGARRDRTFRASVNRGARAPGALTVADVTEFYGDTSGGIRTYLQEKARYVGAHPNLRQILLVPGAEDRIVDAPGSRRYELRGPRVPGQPPYRFMLAVQSSRRILRSEQPDVIEVGSPGLVPWLTGIAARGLNVPRIYVHHSHFPRIIVPLGEQASASGRLVHALLNRYARWIDRLCDVTVACSAFAERELRAAGVSRIVRIPLGVDLDVFHPRRRAAWHGERSQRRLPDGPVAAFVGRFSVDKQVELVVDAWPDVYARTGAHLVLMGDGPLRARLEARLGGTRWGHLLPFEHDRARLADFYASVDIVIAPSAVETFGLSALEAMSAGTPVLAARGSGAGELAEDSGGGAVFTPGDSRSLAESAVALFGRDLATLGQLGRVQAERHHAWDDVFGRMVALYRELIEARA